MLQYRAFLTLVWLYLKEIVDQLLKDALADEMVSQAVNYSVY